MKGIGGPDFFDSFSNKVVLCYETAGHKQFVEGTKRERKVGVLITQPGIAVAAAAACLWG